MDRKTRICIWIIMLGLINFLIFLGMYIIIGGDAKNGRVYKDSAGKVRYLIQMRGREAEYHRKTPTTQIDERFPLTRDGDSRVWHGPEGAAYKDIGRELYIYSGVHSIFIWLTVAAVLLAMLTLAKEQLVTAMADKLISGRAIIHIFATVVVCTTLMMTVLFLLDFIRQLKVN